MPEISRTRLKENLENISLVLFFSGGVVMAISLDRPEMCGLGFVMVVFGMYGMKLTESMEGIKSK